MRSVKRVKKKPVAAFDTETTGLSRFKDNIFVFSTCDQNFKAYSKRIDGKGKDNPKLARKDMARLTDGSHELVFHNAKFDIGFVEQELGIKIAEKLTFHDTMMQSHIMRNDQPSRKLKDLAYVYGNIPTDDEDAIKPYTKNQDGVIDYSVVPAHLMDKYATRDAERTMFLHEFFWPQIKEDPRAVECYNTEIDLIRTTLRMEDRGIMINVDRTKELREQLMADAAVALRNAQGLLGKRYDIGNPEVVRDILYNKLHMPVLKRTSKDGKPSADKDVINQLHREHNHPILDLIVQYRSWTRGATMLESYLGFADEEGIIHPNIRTCKAITSRQSCTEPNLQSVEKTGKLTNPFPVPARKAFRPRPGHVLFFIDYSGIELRLLVHYSGEESFIDCINNNDDPHALGAGVLFPEWSEKELLKYPAWASLTSDKDNSEWAIARGLDSFADLHAAAQLEGDDDPHWKMLRDGGKNANFGIPYGSSGAKVAQIIGVPAGVGVKRFNAFSRAFPKYCGLGKEISSIVRSQGYVETAFGRRIYTPPRKAYMGTNYLIQGTAAGVLKRGQNRAHRYLQEATGGEVQLLLPIHDEIILEFPRKRLSEAKHILGKVRALMVDFPMFNVPMDVSIEYATRDWASKKKFEL